VDAARAKQSPRTANGSGSDEPISNWALIRRLLDLSWRYRGRWIVLIAVNLVLVVVGLTGLTIFGLAVDYIKHQADPTTKVPKWPLGMTPPATWSPMLVISVLAGGLLTTALVYAVMRYVGAMKGALLTQQIVVDLRRQVYDKLQRLSFRFFDASNSGSLINRVAGDVQHVRMFILSVVMQGILVVVTLGVYVTYMFQKHATLALACMAATPLMFIVTFFFSRIVRPMYRKSRDLRDHLVRRLSENVEGVHVVKCFGRQPHQARLFGSANRRVKWQQRRIFQLSSVYTPTIGGLLSLNMIILLSYGGYLVMYDPQFTLGQGLLVFTGLMGGFSAQVNQIAMIANYIQMCLASAQRVFEVLDTPVEIQSPPKPVRLAMLRGAVTFEGVSFAYKDGEPVLSDVSFEAQPGRCIAFLGATGSGKSTLLSLIPRFYDPTAGCVRLDGHDLRELEVDELRRCIGLVFQESFLFSNTVAANIAFGDPHATEKQIIEAATIAAAHQFIMELPRGYNTVIGEHGCDLSGGQRQRLAIARAVLLDPAILILDDATAAVDPETEHEILQAMDNAMKGRTTFVVAHRLSTLRRADRVIVLDKGRVVQDGSHEELMNVKGQYRWAARLQIADDESRRLLGVGEGAV